MSLSYVPSETDSSVVENAADENELVDEKTFEQELIVIQRPQGYEMVHHTNGVLTAAGSTMSSPRGSLVSTSTALPPLPVKDLIIYVAFHIQDAHCRMVGWRKLTLMDPPTT